MTNNESISSPEEIWPCNTHCTVPTHCLLESTNCGATISITLQSTELDRRRHRTLPGHLTGGTTNGFMRNAIAMDAQTTGRWHTRGNTASPRSHPASGIAPLRPVAWPCDCWTDGILQAPRSQWRFERDIDRDGRDAGHAQCW
eukprot:5218422-Prymnesium_polylepis.1